MDGSDLGIPGISQVAEAGRTPATTTYRAVDDATGEAIIVKVLTRDATPEVRARFDYDQARLVELAEHPNIVRVIRHGYTTAGKPYVVTQSVTGASMADKVGAGLDGPAVLALGIRVAGALESAHRRDVVHGDLRPEDILIDPEGEPEVADFGIVMVTGHGPDRATEPQRLAHAAPEQLQTHLPTPASDVYALGSCLYALLAGRPAFVAPGDVSVAAVGARIIAEPPPDLRAAGVPEPVVDAIERAMQKDPAQRWVTAEAFGVALQQAEITLGLPITPMTVLGPDRVIARPTVEETEADAESTAPPPSPPRSKVPLLVGIGALVAVAVVAAIVLLGGDDGGDDRVAPDFTRDVPDVELITETDDSGTITVGRIASWGEVDGRPLQSGAADIVASARDPEGFLAPGGFAISGIEVTVADGIDDGADAVLEARRDGRQLGDACVTDFAPEEETVDGFDGFVQRFENCGGNAELVLFAGVRDGRALVAEIHVVEPEDADAVDAVLDSISIAE